MKIAIMQPYFFPYLGYFQGIYAVDKYILSEHVNFTKGSWISNNRLRVKNGPEFLIKVPLTDASSNRSIAETKIDNSKDWCGKILKSIQMIYRNAYCYKEIFPLLEDIIKPNYEFIHQINGETIKAVARFLDIGTEIETCTDHYLKLEKDLEDIEKGDYSSFPYLNKTKPVKKVARIIAMCRNEGAEEYINAIGGIKLYSKDEFKQYGIDLKFVKTENILYDQQSRDFLPDLSIIDVLFNNGKNGTQELLKRYSLI
jgi:hypothetical protein